QVSSLDARRLCALTRAPERVDEQGADLRSRWSPREGSARGLERTLGFAPAELAAALGQVNGHLFVGAAQSTGEGPSGALARGGAMGGAQAGVGSPASSIQREHLLIGVLRQFELTLAVQRACPRVPSVGAGGHLASGLDVSARTPLDLL